MAKKLGRLILFSALTGAAAAGTYYLLQKKNDSPLKDADDIDDFDDFDEDLDDDFDEQPNYSKSRPYVSLDLENAKEIIGEKVIETIDKTKEKIVEGYTRANTDASHTHAEPTVSQTYTTVSSTPHPDHEASAATAYQDTPTMETEEFFDDTEN